MNRSKAACIRCKKRKTKCSSTVPCQSCIISKSECLYPRKPKKVTILDTDLESLYQQIETLKSQVNDQTNTNDGGYGYQVAGNEGEGKQVDVLQRPDDVRSSKEEKLSIILGSPASEVIYWNLNQFITRPTMAELTISPDFNSFIEEKVYDSVIFGMENRTNFQNIEPMNKLLKDVSIPAVESSLDTVANFINVGYLTIYPNEFKMKLKNYYNNDGNFIPIQPSNNVDYFLLKLLVILSIGAMYESNTLLGSNSFFKEPPGIKYFKLLIQYLPSSYELINFKTANNEDTVNIIELFGLISIYLRFLDKKNASIFFTLNALQLCISLNLHRDVILKKVGVHQKALHNMNIGTNEYNNRIFWSIYCLNRFLSGRIGQPLLMSFKNISIASNYSNYDTNFQYFIELAKISEIINTEIYNNNNLNNKYLLNKIFENLIFLKEWVKVLPEDLKLNITSKTENPRDRLLSSLHCNYLHQIYLNCIPIILNFGKVAISNFKQGDNSKFNITKLSSNIINLLGYTIQSSEMTIFIYLKLNEKLLLRCFGFTDIDYIYSNCLIFIIFIILQINHLPNFNDEIDFDFLKYLEVGLKLLNLMANMGNLVADAKLTQILSLINNLVGIGYKFDVRLDDLVLPTLYDFLNATTGNSNSPHEEEINFANDYIGLDVLQFSDEDLQFINDILNNDGLANDILNREIFPSS